MKPNTTLPKQDQGASNEPLGSLPSADGSAFDLLEPWKVTLTWHPQTGVVWLADNGSCVIQAANPDQLAQRLDVSMRAAPIIAEHHSQNKSSEARRHE